MNRDALIAEARPMALARAKRFHQRGSGLPLDDLIQYAMLGLIEATETWKAERGRWIPFAAWHVRRRLCRAASEDRLIRLPPGADSPDTARVREGIRSLDLMANRVPGFRQDGPDELASQAEDLARAEAALAERPARAQQIVRAVCAGQTCPEIAAELGLTRARVWQIYRATIRHLQAALE